MIKTKTKVSGCFRSIEGAKDYLKIMSYVGTAHKRVSTPTTQSGKHLREPRNIFSNKGVLNSYHPDKFTAQPGDMQPVSPEEITNRASTFYEFFDEDGNPKKDSEKDNDKR